MSAASALLEHEIALISRFLDALREEQLALKAGKAEELLPLIETKAALAEQLNTLESGRQAALGLKHTENPRLAMDEWLNRAKDPLAAVNWKKLLELAREAKTLHDINGRLIDMHLRNTAGSIAILTQKSATPPLYGADGQSAGNSGSRIVDSA